jgi:hypothetical protein
MITSKLIPESFLGTDLLLAQGGGRKKKPSKEAGKLADKMAKTLKKKKKKPKPPAPPPAPPPDPIPDPDPEPQTMIEPEPEPPAEDPVMESPKRPKRLTVKILNKLANEYGYSFERYSANTWALYDFDYMEDAMSLYGNKMSVFVGLNDISYDKWQREIEDHIIENALDHNFRWNKEQVPEEYPEQMKLPKFRALYYKWAGIKDPKAVALTDKLQKTLAGDKGKPVKYKDGYVKIPVYGRPLPGIDMLAEYNWLLKNLFDGEINKHPDILGWKRFKKVSGWFKASHMVMKIEINNALKMSPSTFRSVLAHEMIHQLDYQENSIFFGNDDSTGHGRFFRKKMNQFNKKIASKKLPIDPIQPTDTTADIREYLPTGNEKPKVWIHLYDRNRKQHFVGNVYNKSFAMRVDDPTQVSGRLIQFVRMAADQLRQYDYAVYESNYPDLGRYKQKRSFRSLEFSKIDKAKYDIYVLNSKKLFEIKKG